MKKCNLWCLCIDDWNIARRRLSKDALLRRANVKKNVGIYILMQRYKRKQKEQDEHRDRETEWQTGRKERQTDRQIKRLKNQKKDIGERKRKWETPRQTDRRTGEEREREREKLRYKGHKQIKKQITNLALCNYCKDKVKTKSLTHTHKRKKIIWKGINRKELHAIQIERKRIFILEVSIG